MGKLISSTSSHFPQSLLPGRAYRQFLEAAFEAAAWVPLPDM